MSEQDDPAKGRETTVFFSYSRADQAKAKPIIDVLEKAGFSVWWDGLLEGGERFAHITEAALDRARAVVVLWSRTSVNSHWVHDESTRGRDSGRLVPLSLDGSNPPLGFGQFQCLDLSHASFTATDPEMVKLVRAVAALHGEEAAPEIPAPPSSPRITRRAAIIGGGVAATAVAGLAAWRSGLFGPGKSPNGVAVLPFKNLSGEADQTYFSEGLTSEIRSHLSRNALLEVVGQTSSNEFRDFEGSAREIASSLGVAFLLDGNVQKAGDIVKVTTDLSDGRDGSSRWSESFERPLTDIFAVQSEIAQAVASALSAAMEEDGDGDGPAQLGGTDSIAAFDAYLRGKELYESSADETSDRLALAKFDEALAIDPGYAAAAASRSRILVVIANLYSAFEERTQLYDEAVQSAQQATELAPKFADGYSALGFAFASGKLDMKSGRKAFQTSYELGSGDADTVSRYANFQSRVGEYRVASDAIARAAKLDPLNSRVFRSSGDVHFFGRQYELAITQYRRAIALNPDIGNYHSLLGYAQLMLGDLDGAYASFSQEMSSVRQLPGYAIIAHKRGNQAEAASHLAALIEEYGDKSHYQYAQVYAQWGDVAKAVEALETAWNLRDGGLIALYVDPLLDPVRQEPQYAQLASAMGFV
ncbi:TIR domain-containing protein [Erythrobacter sp. JK5]|uniref:TIR domain-containing protein n=1 Tax=Erythrobacter sp. JK5 TaxID=2829500 RepID=UPI001BABAA7B|nr:TIR domain-containing protein [Erythrobacter sp. JK5]QUL37970.1 TIR domain-containing protein [Erythrobacter sp. JK5]